MNSQAWDEISIALYRARRDRVPISPLSEIASGLSILDAYEIQRRFAARLLADGAQLVGHKLGLTSKAMQELLGVYEPDYGPVLSSMMYEDDKELEFDAFLQPKVEAEIALVLAAPLRGPGVTPLDVQRATRSVVAAIEVVDSRIVDWRIALLDTIADLASCGAVLVSPDEVPFDEALDLESIEMQLYRNGHREAVGQGSEALGSPLNAVAWLANTLAPFGVTLEAGHMIMTGALHSALPVSRGDHFEARFDRLGAVSCRFV